MESVHNLAETAALVLAAIWAYYKFFRGRTFRPRLKLTASGTIRPTGASAELLAVAQIENVGLSKLEISQAGTALIISRSLPITEETGPLVPWEELIVLPVLKNRAKLKKPPKRTRYGNYYFTSLAESTALKLDLRIVTNKIEWNQVSIIPADCKDPFRTEVESLREEKTRWIIY